MSEQLEIEFKNLLTKSEYHLLLNYFSANKSELFTQSNSYFDTADWALKNLNAGLRIRLLPDSAELTLKTPYQSGLLETTDTLSLVAGKELLAKEKIKADGAVAEKLMELEVPINKLNLLGTLTTTRFEKKTNDGLFVLDESHYSNKVDYEIELEVTEYSQGRSFFEQFLKEHQIPIRPVKNKIARLVESRFN